MEDADLSRHYPAKPATIEVTPVRFAQWRGDLATPYRFWPDAWRRWKRLHWVRKAEVSASIAVYVASLFLPDGLNLLGLVNISLMGSVLRRRADPELADLAPSPLPADHYPVHVEFTCEAVRYGEDDGMVTFEDGWLIFEGLACSFSVRSTDAKVLRRPATNEPTNKENESIPEDELRLVFGAVAAKLVPYSSISAGELALEDVGAKLTCRVRAWVRESVPEGSSMYPPAFAHPITVGWGRVSGSMAGGTLWLLAVPLIITYFRDPHALSAWLVSSLACLLLVVGAFAPRLAQRSYERLLKSLAKFRESSRKGINPLP